ncbi:uncharacterized protein N7496_004370 [Penicillium cataractarum]|uniref:2EXR domain-containing protein n=1 Tax=Penicillium cataractarum TaxID=2100454 RepID=A0A9W9VHB6_9EURO|nr:uncharacterized protein N7496_004370 [Penicillium cataractarum]KAJ5381942.1 hypothetical protein N7496_004370 [Penicillium cataractarum]
MSDQASPTELTFHLFPKLPTELRLQIWRLCLPHRVTELDNPTPEGLYDSNQPVCHLKHTSILNGSSPVIARVCTESRKVAYQSNANSYESLHKDFYKDLSPFDMFDSPTAESDYWMDPERDIVHLNYSPRYGWIAYAHDWGNPFRTLAWFAERNGGRVSFMEEWIVWLRSDPKAAEALVDLERVERWLVVLRVVVIHADAGDVEKTGLFGLLGDALVQVVPVSEEARVNAFYDLAERLDRERGVKYRQNLERYSVEWYREGLRQTVQYGLETDDSKVISKVLKRLQPAVMVRLCTDMCNSSCEVME